MKDPYKLSLEFLAHAESLFGQSNNDWMYVGVEFYDQNPHLRYYPESGHVTISLSFKALTDELQLIFQLSHEVCHLLHPSRDYPSLENNDTLVINEGISTYFSVLKTDEFFQNKYVLLENLKRYSTSYYYAYLLIEQLLEIDKELIKKIRFYKKKIDKITEEDFEELNFDIPKSLREQLLTVFSKR